VWIVQETHSPPRGLPYIGRRQGRLPATCWWIRPVLVPWKALWLSYRLSATASHVPAVEARCRLFAFPAKLAAMNREESIPEGKLAMLALRGRIPA